MMPQHHLIDVRTPSEYSTGFLSLSSNPALNIEYQLISKLSTILSVQKNDKITLYCRSGRRSNIALQTLMELGYSDVRDIGGLEEARAVLQREEMLGAVKENTGVTSSGLLNEDKNRKGEKEAEKEARQKSLGALLEGLRGLE
jgi:rhodanese-related sulfurtransferase